MTGLPEHIDRSRHHRQPRDLDTWLKSRSDRCDGCGAHVATQGHGPDCAPIAPADEWTTFLTVLREVAVDGVVHQKDVRPKIRGRIYHKHIGQLYKRARNEGVLVQIDKEPSGDVVGKNTHHDSPVYQLRGAA